VDFFHLLLDNIELDIITFLFVNNATLVTAE
jgi:hypothetical protein